MSSCIIELFKWLSSRGAYKELERRLSELGFTVSNVNPESKIYKVYKKIVNLDFEIETISKLESAIYGKAPKDWKPIYEQIEKIKRIVEEISKKYDLTYSMDGPHWMAGGVLGILIGFK